jgi:hypothetical protein
MTPTTAPTAREQLTHPHLPPIPGFQWTRIREDEAGDGGNEVTLLLMAPGERAGMLTITLYPDRVLLRHLLVDSGVYTRGSSYRGQKLGSRMLDRALAAYGHLPIDVWFAPDCDDPGLTVEQLRAWCERRGFVPHPDSNRPGWMRLGARWTMPLNLCVTLSPAQQAVVLRMRAGYTLRYKVLSRSRTRYWLAVEEAGAPDWRPFQTGDYGL